MSVGVQMPLLTSVHALLASLKKTQD